MKTILALAFFWFLFASSSGFGVTGDFSKNKLQYDIANVRQLPISYKVFRSMHKPYLNRLRKTKSYKNSNFGKLYAVGGCNSLCRILERKIIENYLRNNNKGLDDVQGKYGHFLRDRRSQAEEDLQLPWQMEYFSPRLRRDARPEAKEDGQLLPWEMEYFTPRLS